MDKYNLIRADNSFIENEYLKGDSEYLGIVVSGLGYSLSRPLLYYSISLLIDNKIDYLGINLGYNKNEDYKKLSQEDRKKYINNDMEIIYNKINEISGNYKKIIFIGKSIGTGIIRKCIKKDTIREKSFLVLITPPGEVWELTIDEIKDTNVQTLVIGSLMDKLYTVKNLTDVYEKSHIKIYELEEGDHSLEINDTIKNIEHLKMFMEMINEFIKKHLLN